MNPCCPCDELVHPGKPDIPAGLSSLPRQLAGFPDYRLAMLRDIAVHAPLSQWRARHGDDLGIMLLEMWAYVLDILAFYDARIANESYLRTGTRRPSLRRLVELIGYLPRPALAASVVLAAFADGNRSITLPPRTAFRSDAFNDEPPQVFETETDHAIHPLTNEWTLGPVKGRATIDELLLDPSSARPAVGSLVLLRWASPGSAAELRPRRVAAVSRVASRDGLSYTRVTPDSPPDLDPALDRNAVEVLAPERSAPLNLAVTNPVTTTSLLLDTVYPRLAEQDPVIVQRGNTLHAAVLTDVSSVDVAVSPAPEAPTLPASRIAIDPPLPSGWTSDAARLLVHFQMTVRGALTQEAKIHLEVSDFAAPGISTVGLAEPWPEGVANPDRVLLRDARDTGVLADGSVHINGDGQGMVRLDANTPAFDPLLRAPVTVFGNLVQATRGESVSNEVLGSGDGAQAFQTFTLAKSPLTYLNDPSSPIGWRNTLEVRVNGILWSEVASFFGAGPHDEVYIVRQNDREETLVTFGDGRTGARLPSGVDNVAAIYRFGAGRAKPPAGAIGQVARPVEGLRRVTNPVAAAGGADADAPEEIRRNAPTSALMLGRAVSLIDFEALARAFGGVINATATWAWDGTSQDAVVKVWYIADGGDIGPALRAWLIARADPTTPIVVGEGTPEPSELILDLEVDPRFEGPRVADRVLHTLTDGQTGPLALQNVPIGQPLFRSRLFATVLAVEGVRSVRAISVDGIPAPFAIPVGEEAYRDFLGRITIATTPAKA